MAKKIIVVMAMLLVLSVGVGVSAEEWYLPYVRQTEQLGLTFENDTVTNEEFVASVLSIMSETTEGMTAIQYAKTQGYVAEQEMSDPSAAVTRQTIAKVISRVLRLPDGHEALEDNITDWEDTCPYCKPYILKCYVSGIISGYEDGTFRGRYAASSNEVAAILVRAYKYGKEKI